MHRKVVSIGNSKGVSIPVEILNKLDLATGSDVFFSYHNFPDFAIPVIQKLPLTMMADSVRSVFIEGAGITQVSLNAFILSLLGIVCFAIGLRIFKWY